MRQQVYLVSDKNTILFFFLALSRTSVLFLSSAGLVQSINTAVNTSALR